MFFQTFKVNLLDFVGSLENNYYLCYIYYFLCICYVALNKQYTKRLTRFLTDF